jgi:hypothetical protein
MSDPHDIATDLRACAAWISEPFADAEMVGRLTVLADSFDQPGDGPLAYDETLGRMVRLVPTAEHVTMADGEMSLVIHDGWRFPSRVTTEGAD